MKPRMRHSLLYRYLLIVLCALIIIPILFPLAAVVVFLPAVWTEKKEWNKYESGTQLEAMWHKEAGSLKNATVEQIRSRLQELKQFYNKSSVYWVDEQGNTQFKLPETVHIPDMWSASYTVSFMKQRYGGDPFTSVAFLDGDEPRGFIVFEVPRTYIGVTSTPYNAVYSRVFFGALLIMLALFLFVSFMFFYRIRKRLVRLQTAMTSPALNGIPTEVAVLKPDEIGQLEKSFNAMIRKLEEGKHREEQEELLRKELIAKLSHDLRTPLTAIRTHAFSLQEETLSDKGRQSVELIENKMIFLGELIENLFSYSLLSAGKYPYRPKQVEITRMCKVIFAGWYPLFEKEQFHIEVDFTAEVIHWVIDPAWLERVLDNYFQNVLRHARSGKYIAVRVSELRGGMIEIADKGPGMGASEVKGTGMGLTIIQLMLNEMGMVSNVYTDGKGTQIRLSKK